MGISRLFWPQELLNQWIVDEKISMEGESLTINKEKQTYRVKQAVLFASDVGDGDDRFHLVGRVKDLSTLEAMGAEHYMDSVIIQDSAYQVVGGFVGERTSTADVGPIGKPRGVSASAPSGEDNGNDKELLAKFLIDNL